MIKQRITVTIAAAAAAGLALALSACGGSSSPKLTHVFTTVPWTGNETLNYDIVDQGGDLTGVCQLETKVDTSPGKTTLVQDCSNAGDNEPGRYRDDRTAIVDSKTLKPFSATRTTSDAKKDTRTTFTSTYSPTEVKFQANDNGTLHGTNRDLPKPSDSSPDPGYYDDEELFWIIRGIPLEKDWEGAYIDVNASNGQTITARIRVEDQEKVTVPAGTFNVWKVRLSTSSVTQFFWIDASPPHHVIQADIEDTTYKLKSAK
ncbi:DUF3108 domain-containing protein [bacterium]|jgi:hypothetical protein|nr:DUF3108 domain-containing protein [bacterium]